MEQAAEDMIDDAVTLVPEQGAGVLDIEHLARMTLGERALECEVLRLFDRQSELLLQRMRQAAPDAVAALAHTLKGSARGIGAWSVAQAAEAVEASATRGADGERAGRMAELATAVQASRTVIAGRLRGS